MTLVSGAGSNAGMNCVRPAVSAEDEFYHRVREFDVGKRIELQRKVQAGDFSSMSEWERGVAECWRDALAEGARPIK